MPAFGPDTITRATGSADLWNKRPHCAVCDVERGALATKDRLTVSHIDMTVSHIDRAGITAAVRGDGVTYQASWTAALGWGCTCPARGRCAHLLALALVVDISAGRATAGRG